MKLVMPLEKCTNIVGNLTQQENIALRLLCAQHSLTIKQADKGGNIVVMSIMQYKAMCLKILQNDVWCKKITSTTVERFCEALYTLFLRRHRQGYLGIYSHQAP